MNGQKYPFQISNIAMLVYVAIFCLQLAYNNIQIKVSKEITKEMN